MTAPATTADGRVQTSAPGPLGKDAKSAATAGQGHAGEFWARQDAALRDKYRARRELAGITSLRRVARCGRVSTNAGGEVSLHYTPGPEGEPGTAGFGGLATCGSVWACPVCSAKISARRSKDLEQLINWNAERGGTVALLTLTMRHHRGHSLRELRRALSTAWRFLTSSRGWKRWKADLDMDYVRGVEGTHSDLNGWHLHIHALLIFPTDVSAEIPALTCEVYSRWAVGLAKKGMSATAQRGVDIRVGDGAVEKMGKYISKLAFETAGGRWKRGKRGSRTPFQILADAIESGNDRDVALWNEWEQGTHGMQQLVWSNGLKERCGVADAQDEEIAEESADGELAAVLPARTWKRVYVAAEDLIVATRHGGVAAARGWLDGHGLPYDFEHDTTERAVQLDHADAPFAWLRETLAEERRAARAARRG